MIGAALLPVVVAAVLAAPSGGAAPAPAGTGQASGLRVAPLDTCVSCTGATAGPHGTRARATALRVLGNDVSGGASHDGGSAGDALLALPSNPVLDLALADWSTGTESGSPPAAQSRTALVDAGVLPSGEDSTTGGLVTVAVLESFGDATWSGSSSGGYGASNGADIGLANGALVIILLHSQATSDDHGDAYVASVGGVPVLGTTGHSPGTPVGVPGVLGVTLLEVGADGGGGSSAVATVDQLLGDPGQAGAVLSSGAQGQPHPPAGADTAPPASAVVAAAGVAPPAVPRVAVPTTGAAAGVAGALLVLGGVAIAGGVARTGRRRRCRS
jgi:hypothetical protein